VSKSPQLINRYVARRKKEEAPETSIPQKLMIVKIAGPNPPELQPKKVQEVAFLNIRRE